MCTSMCKLFTVRIVSAVCFHVANACHFLLGAARWPVFLQFNFEIMYDIIIEFTFDFAAN